MRKEHNIASTALGCSRKPRYIIPRTEAFALTGTDGLLQTLSLTGAPNASDNGNPPVDVKDYGIAGDWGEIWGE